MQKYFILDVWSGSEYACVEIAPNNVLYHHKKTSDRIFRIPRWLEDNLSSFQYSRKTARVRFLRKTRICRVSSPLSQLIQYNIHAPWRATSTIQTNRDHHHFFHLDTNPVLGHVLIHSVDKTHVLVATV